MILKNWIIYEIQHETFNNTALVWAAENGHKEIVELLIRQEGIDINIKDILNQKHSWNSNLTFLIWLKNWMIYGI